MEDGRNSGDNLEMASAKMQGRLQGNSHREAMSRGIARLCCGSFVGYKVWSRRNGASAPLSHDALRPFVLLGRFIRQSTT